MVCSVGGSFRQSSQQEDFGDCSGQKSLIMHTRLSFKRRILAIEYLYSIFMQIYGMKFQKFREHERRVVVLETGLGLFKGLDLVSDSEAFPQV